MGLDQLVASAYDLGEITGFRHLFSSVNDTYAVRCGATSYALRVHRADPWWIAHDDELRFELDLLAYLDAAGVPVPVPVPRRNGDPLGRLDSGRFYTLFTWAPGSPGHDTPNRVRLVGETLARIHVASDGFESAHSRYHLDEANLLDRYLAKLEPTAEQAAYIDEHAAGSRRLDSGPTVWGGVPGDVPGWTFHCTEREMIPTIGRLAWIREEIGATALVRRLRAPYMSFV